MAVATKVKSTWMPIKAKPCHTLPLFNKVNTSALNVLKVVSPPKNPVVINSRKFGCIFWVSIKANPINSPPSTLANNVP